MPITRRRFIQSSAALSAAYFMPAASWARVHRANERINLAVIGCGGMGSSHLNDLMGRRERDNVALTHVCDVYRRRLNRCLPWRRSPRISARRFSAGSTTPPLE